MKNSITKGLLDFSLIKIDYPGRVPRITDRVRVICSVHGEFSRTIRQLTLYGCASCESGLKPKGWWTDERILEEALKHKTKRDWCKSSSASFSAAQDKGILDICCRHMVDLRKPNHFWSVFENCYDEAKKHDSRNSWKKSSSASYNAAIRNGWMEKCSKHMVQQRKPKGWWTLDRCIKDAKKHNLHKSWRESGSGGYDAALKNGWIDKCTTHMSDSRPNRNRTLESCKVSALNHSRLTEWKKADPKSVDYAYKHGWIALCCEHMIPHRLAA